MTSARGWLTPIIVLMLSGPVMAQPILPLGGGFSIRNNCRGLSFSISAGYGCGFAPIGYPGCARAFYPPCNTGLTIVNVTPPPAPPPVVLPPLVDPLLGVRFDRLDDLERQQAQLPPVVDRPAPGQQVGGFRPIQPGNREQAKQPVAPEPKPKPPEPKPQPKPPEPKPGQLPPPPAPDPDVRVEYDRQVFLGQEAFATGQYGRAATRFRNAITISPDQPLALFLLGQTLFALAKYDEAAAVIMQGLRRQPDWPVMGFRPLRLYEGNIADYPEHLRHLEAVVDQNPDDPVLLFLYAYQLWFDGRQEEALALFERAAPRLPDRSAADLFLKHRPSGAPIV